MDLLIDIILSIPVALLVTFLIVWMLVYVLMVLVYIPILLLFSFAYFSHNKLTIAESRERVMNAFDGVEYQGFNEFISRVIFVLIYALCIYLSTQIEGFPFPALFGG